MIAESEELAAKRQPSGSRSLPKARPRFGPLRRPIWLDQRGTAASLSGARRASGSIKGSVLSDKAATWSGNTTITYNGNVVASIHTGSSTIAVLVPGT